MRFRVSGLSRWCVAAAVLAAAAAQSCAYLNTLYNARRIYGDAEKATAEKAAGRADAQAGAREQREKYKEVVKKCSQMIQSYPKSRWVDDAMFLMGNALVRQEEYDKAIRKFQEILTNFPESDYVPKSLYWLALAYHLKKDDTQALVHCERFINGYPKHDLRFDALFLGGDIKRSLEDYEGALRYYGIVAAEAKKKEIVDESLLKSAELLRGRGEWEKAAANYRKVLRKGIQWRQRFDISLALGECLAKTGQCAEALALFDGLLEKATATVEIPPLLLGRAASYACMDSLPRALAVYRSVRAKYPKSVFSAEASYRAGVIYQERLDSLKLAADAFAAVGGEYANSEFAAASLEKSSSIRRLLDLQKAAAGEQSAEQAAERRFVAAEIQLTRLDEVSMALAGYEAVLDSFPGTTVAPKAAFAIAWIHENKLGEKEAAVRRYGEVVRRYPRSFQAKGALYELELAGADSLAALLQAYRDSALADTASLPVSTASADTTGAPVPASAVPAAVSDSTAVPRRTPANAPGRFPRPPQAAPVPFDTLGKRNARPDTVEARRDTIAAPADTLGPSKRGGVE